MRPDGEWGETLSFGDVPTGSYLLKTYFDGIVYTRPITVADQTTTFVLIEGEQRPSPTPSPEAEPPVPDRGPSPTLPGSGEPPPSSTGG